MSVIELQTVNFRNLNSEKLSFHPKLNYITGDNGSGKSSLLESLFYLGHGKSFRTSHIDSLICTNTDSFIVSVKIENNIQLGIQRNIQGESNIKINGAKHTKLSDLAKNFAIQIVTPESFKLFVGGPKERRKFVDLGMFHVKHSFSALWQDFSRTLKQRNACLKKRVSASQLTYWTEEFCRLSELIAALRNEYIVTLREEVTFWLSIVLPSLKEEIHIRYSQGWANKKELRDVLDMNLAKEYERGFSLFGAQKFDIKFLIDNLSIEHRLSRGQQKLFLLALTFAQTSLIAKVNRLKPILLIDDIGAELDHSSRTAMFSAIQALECQTMITAIDSVALEPLIPVNNNYKMFHVKHGQISAMSK